MRIEAKYIQKMGGTLLKKFVASSRSTQLRVIMRLERLSKPEHNIFAFNFSTQKQFREALIEQRKIDAEIFYAPLLNKLQELGLIVKGGMLSGILVVEGCASQIYEALKLEGIVHADLDQKISLIEKKDSRIVSV